MTGADVGWGEAVEDSYLRMRTQMATREYASRVPMDMRSTRAARSNRKAIKAAKKKEKKKNT